MKNDTSKSLTALTGRCDDPGLSDLKLSQERNGEQSITSDATAPSIVMSDAQDPLAESPVGPKDHESSGENDSDDHLVEREQRSRAPRVSQKRQADTAAFQEWISNNQAEVTAPKKKKSALISGATASSIIKADEGSRIIENPREYQIELFERAKEKNIIAVLPTGSGKTLIAALLLRHTLEQEVNGRHAGKQKRVAFFLVEKVALALQQHVVLENNLDHPVACFCGDMGQAEWDKSYWHKQWEDNMVVVCTAAILQQCLARSFIRLDQISLLIFDEAHHCKGRHPYARILKDFFIPEKDLSKRPKILGMTASPVDAQTDVVAAAQQLEGLLHAEIATVSEDSASYKGFQRDVVERDCLYAPLPRPFITRLHDKIAWTVKSNILFAKHLAYSREATVALGPWCADRFWHLLLTDTMLSRLAAKTQQEHTSQATKNQQVASVWRLGEFLQSHKFMTLVKSTAHLSPKVLSLLSQLEVRFREPTKRKCIVFVDQRNTAMLLVDILCQPGIKPTYLKPGYLIGSQADLNPFSMSYKEQVVAIAKLKSGEYNCLISTAVAEEGIDIPDCDIVIRFDLFKSAIQYVQSRGRARCVDSEFLCMSEMGNGKHMKLKLQTMQDLAAVREFCQALPEDRKISGWEAEAAAEHSERHHKSHLVASTGARLTWTGSLVVLASFVNSLQHGEESLTPTYMVTYVNGRYVCDVQLPARSPIAGALGEPQTNKTDARCSAAFKLCLELLKHRHIDDHLRPRSSKMLPAMRNARLAVSSKKRSEYKMRSKPEIWSRLGPVCELFLTIVTLEDPEAMGRSSRPILLLTREKLPILPSVPLFFGNDAKSHAKIRTLQTPFCPSTEDLVGLSTFTLRIFKDVFSKEFECEGVEQLPYFLAPTLKHHEFAFSQCSADGVRDLVDWDHLHETKDIEYQECSENTPAESYENKFAIDPGTGARKFYLKQVKPDKHQLDLVPDTVPAPGHRAWKKCEHNIQEYSFSGWTASRGKMEFRQDQPVVEAELVPLRRNFLDECQEPDNDKSKTCFVIVEPLRISTLPLETVVMAMIFPAVIHRIHDSLIALDACTLLGLDICPSLALEALTKDSDNSGEHDEEKVNFQVGMGNNYERLEFLGDCFLKMATTIALFTQTPDCDEFEYHVARMLLICNQNLFNKALNKNLQEYVRSRQFDRRSWYPDGLKLKRGKATGAKSTHSLADKSIADVCEALIGASYLSGTNGSMDKAVCSVTIMVSDKRHKMLSYKDYFAGFHAPKWQTMESTGVQLELAGQIEKQLGYKFKFPALLRSAFKHPSFPRQYDPVPHYQRLEFLGDSLLDMVCVDFLFHKFPQADPQWLTEHKMAMVSNHFLGSLCVHLGFHKHILHFSGAMTNQTTEFVESLKMAREEAEAESRVHESGKVAQDYWQNVSQPPKFLSDVVEAYIGAIFVDSGYDYSCVQQFFEAHVRRFFTDMALYDSFASRHPVTLLGHVLQQDIGCKDWRLLVSEVPLTVEEAGAKAMSSSQVICGFLIHGQVVTYAKSASGRNAKIAAAKRALGELKQLGEGDEAKKAFREKHNCDCHK